MARQRLVKPEFFQHEGLHGAELVSGLPLRMAYLGLWTQADRRGLFKWRPSRLKLNILPFDDVDFDAVLEALETGGFVRSYVVAGERYGCIPTFTKHQSFHKREAPDKDIPDPPKPETAQGQHGAGTGQAQGQHGASPSVTVTVDSTVDSTVGVGTAGTVPAPDWSSSSWPAVIAAQWSATIGPVPIGRLGKLLKTLVDTHGAESVGRGLGDYLQATPASKARLEWFAERGTYWVNLAAMPLIDPATCQPTERYRVTVEGKAA